MEQKVWTFSEESRLIRVYLRLWQGSASDINFCKLFWGTLFAPLALPCYAIGGGVLWLGENTVGRFAHFLSSLKKEENDEWQYLRMVESQLPKPNNRFQQLLESIQKTVDRIAARAQSSTALRRGALVLLGGLIVALAIDLGYWAVQLGVFLAPHWVIICYVLGGIVAAAIVVSLFVGVIYLLSEIGGSDWFDSLMHFLGGIVGRLGDGIVTVFRFIGTGIHSVKHRTCPRVVIRRTSQDELS